ncbi:hypothetical protein [Mesoaciditoga sp.]
MNKHTLIILSIMIFMLFGTVFAYSNQWVITSVNMLWTEDGAWHILADVTNDSPNPLVVDWGRSKTITQSFSFSGNAGIRYASFHFGYGGSTSYTETLNIHMTVSPYKRGYLYGTAVMVCREGVEAYYWYDGKIHNTDIYVFKGTDHFREIYEERDF